MRVQVVSLKEWEDNGSNYEGFTEYARTSGKAVIVKSGTSALSPDNRYLSENLKLIVPKDADTSQKIF